VSHCGLANYIKKYLKEKKNYGNSNISPCKIIIYKKSSKRNPKSFKILYNSGSNLKPKYHLSKILI